MDEGKGCQADALPGLGPASRQMLAAAGINTVAELQQCGAVGAYILVRRCHAKASLNLLWALEGALTGQRWQDVARHHRTSLLLSLEQAEAAVSHESFTLPSEPK